MRSVVRSPVESERGVSPLPSFVIFVAGGVIVACGGTVKEADGRVVFDAGGSGGAVVLDAGGSGGAVVDLHQITCDRTSDAFAMSITMEDNETLTCSASDADAGTQDVSIDASVVDTSFSPGGETSQLTLDTCPPNARCSGNTSVRVSLTAPGITIANMRGRYVHVDARFDHARWRCTQQILIRNLPTWNGVSNPAGGGNRVHLAASDGTWDTFADAPFSVERVRLPCPGTDAGPPCGPDAGTYALEFFPVPGSGWDSVIVPMGKAATFWNLKGDPEQEVFVRNLRSYETGACDSYWDWGWWMTPAWRM